VVSRSVLAGIGGVCLGLCFAGDAAADGCVHLLGGLYRSQGCPPRTSEGSPPAGSIPSLERPFQPFDSPVPLLRPARVPAKEGPTTLGDLQLVPDEKGGYRGSRPGFRFKIASDGTIRFQDRRSAGLPTFDLTDMVIRLQGGDPYAYDKALVISLTRPLRERMTDEDRGRRMRLALHRLPADLQAVWRRKDLDAATRRGLLFLLWDELLEEGDPAEPEELEAAHRARALIQEFIGAHLPSGSVEAYTAGELQRFNSARRSRAGFAPYQRPAAD
jgi:hypothetical protein